MFSLKWSSTEKKPAASCATGTCLNCAVSCCLGSGVPSVSVADAAFPRPAESCTASAGRETLKRSTPSFGVMSTSRQFSSGGLTDPVATPPVMTRSVMENPVTALENVILTVIGPVIGPLASVLSVALGASRFASTSMVFDLAFPIPSVSTASAAMWTLTVPVCLGTSCAVQPRSPVLVSPFSSSIALLSTRSVGSRSVTTSLKRISMPKGPFTGVSSVLLTVACGALRALEVPTSSPSQIVEPTPQPPVAVKCGAAHTIFLPRLGG